MQELRLVAVSEDGTYLVLATAGRGTRFTLPVDDRLRAAVRGHFSRLGQFEIEVESPLRPKEIQARIRSGETAEEIAESAGIPVERVRWFEGPVLQEREYMAQQAQRVAVRRPGESTPGPPLGETVEERLGRGGVDLEEVEWDSWKCEDNTWRVRLSFFDNGRPHAAEWTFDPRRRHVSPLDEIAARLTAVEWDDEPLSDTVTPLVPRRPAMKVVSSDRDLPPRELPPRDQPRDLAPRGLPTEPDQPEPVEQLGRRERPERSAVREPLRAAEPRASIVEHGPGNDPRGPFRRPGETVALREAAQPHEPDDRSEPAAVPPAPLRPTAATEPADETELTETTDSSETTDSAEKPEPAAEATADVESRETVHPQEQEDEGDAAVEKDTIPAEEPKAVADRREDTTDDVTGDVDDAASDTAPVEAPAEASVEASVEAAVDAPVEKASGEASAPPPEAEPTAPEAPEAEAPEAEISEGEGGEAAPDKPATPQRAPQRQSPRPPAKKKQTGRPAMPAAAAQDKPAASSPAAASGEPAARPARRRKSKAKRASVPSWDEIMFGARRPE
ncbi:Protein of unknown function (DUF3071) [Actinomadura pelletieri DSM 43383]|uniref:DUF3071 domain-containing protein n=1 Tax=Actinomadura pelletieri DSM 43383 TaxID=1120940 RepID=A0A495QAQ2_9ACTN|nr:septation protein SepH [Actinomadura pelletieri]RKS68768.1 Protein of unknown function (DUF3071) [Actinomadura pelletieri DSM 43383]